MDEVFVGDDPLYVFHGRRRVGRISADPLKFVYDTTWLSARDSFALSVALPLRPTSFDEADVRAFFFNLLPEGQVRRRLAGRLKISEGNDYALLAAVGGECAGAIAVLPTPADANPESGRERDDFDEHAYDALSDDDITQRIAMGGALSSAAGESGVRLSLAGAQDKLPVYIDASGNIFLPKGQAASTHIIKFENRDFKHLAVNEAFVLRLAEAVGLPCVRSTLRRLGRSNALVVERYDRLRAGARVERLHQEDFCQALNVPAERKYEAEGGPSFAQSVELVRKHSSDPLADVHAVVRWQIFNAAVGNADGHAKNLALLHTPTGTRLAPFYDLVSTRAYPRVDRHLAMHIGATSDPDQLTAKDWSRFATDLGVGARYVRDTATQVLSAIGDALIPTVRALEKAFGRKDFLRSAVVPGIEKCTRRVTASLKAQS
ncbi:MAG: type II toxin-antitoxin system HipA family toxin [Deltaproteobacteria bacterium]|nr:type II toxin-antitoxin system HipA family toxin [Deltaproteobacteria bacterium]